MRTRSSEKVSPRKRPAPGVKSPPPKNAGLNEEFVLQFQDDQGVWHEIALKGARRGISAFQSTSHRVSAWKRNLHADERQSALQFASEEKLDAFIDGIWRDASLRDMPRAHVGDNTVIVPSEAVGFLKDVCDFVESPVVPAGSVPARP